MFDFIKNKITNGFWKKLSKNTVTSIMNRAWYSYISDNISDCWAITFNYQTMFDIQRMNTEAQQSKNLIVKMVWKKWMNFKNGKDIVEDKIWEEKIKNLFTDPLTGSFRSMRDKYYTNNFCSWMVFWYKALNWLWEPVIQILDSRWIDQYTDNYGNINRILYNNKELDIQRVFRQINLYDPNLPKQWMSVYESVVYDAFSDKETSKRNYYFFKNNAMPWVILTLDDEIENPEEIEAAIKQFEENYKWSEKSNKVLASGWIKEVRTIDVSNKDLELLELKKFSIKKMGVIFWFDPRFLWYKDDANWSHAEYQVMANQSDKSMTDFADTLEDFMFRIVKSIYKDFRYTWIELINDQFMDEVVKQELIEKKVEKWLCTLKQWIQELWYSTKNIPAYMDTYILNTQWNSIDNIFKKAELDQKLTDKTIKQTSEDSSKENDLEDEDKKT